MDSETPFNAERDVSALGDVAGSMEQLHLNVSIPQLPGTSKSEPSFTCHKPNVPVSSTSPVSINLIDPPTAVLSLLAPVHIDVPETVTSRLCFKIIVTLNLANQKTLNLIKDLYTQ